MRILLLLSFVIGSISSFAELSTLPAQVEDLLVKPLRRSGEYLILEATRGDLGASAVKKLVELHIAKRELQEKTAALESGAARLADLGGAIEEKDLQRVVAEIRSEEEALKSEKAELKRREDSLLVQVKAEREKVSVQMKALTKQKTSETEPTKQRELNSKIKRLRAFKQNLGRTEWPEELLPQREALQNHEKEIAARVLEKRNVEERLSLSRKQIAFEKEIAEDRKKVNALAAKAPPYPEPGPQRDLLDEVVAIQLKLEDLVENYREELLERLNSREWLSEKDARAKFLQAHQHLKELIIAPSDEGEGARELRYSHIAEAYEEMVLASARLVPTFVDKIIAVYKTACDFVAQIIVSGVGLGVSQFADTEVKTTTWLHLFDYRNPYNIYTAALERKGTLASFGSAGAAVVAFFGNIKNKWLKFLHEAEANGTLRALDKRGPLFHELTELLKADGPARLGAIRQAHCIQAIRTVR